MSDEIDPRRWEQVYQQKSAQEVSWYQASPDLSLRLIEQAGLSRDDALIDAGGGASTLVDGLLAARYRDISVLDIADAALQAARSRLGGQAADVHWLHQDITTWAPPRQYKLWHDRAVFHFLTRAADRRRYVDALGTGLAPGGHLLLATFAVGGATRCSGLDIVQYDAEKIVRTLGDDFLLLETVQEQHLTPAGRQQAFNYFLFRHLGGS